MKTRGLFFIIFFFVGTGLQAQGQWSFEFRPNLDFATTKIGEKKIKTGFGFDANLTYNFIDNMGVYAGWGWNTYRAENIPDTGNIDLNQTGYTFGLQYINSIKETSLGYFLRFGGIYAHVEVENEAGNNIADTSHELGWEIAGGLYLFNVSTFSLRPQLGYRSFSGDFSSGFVSDKLDLNNFFFGIGVAKWF